MKPRHIITAIIGYATIVLLCSVPVGRHPTLDNTVPVVDVLCINDKCDTLWYNILSMAGIENAVVRMSNDTVYVTVRRK